MKEKQERVKDALKLRKQQFLRVFFGGGISFLKVKRALDKIKVENSEEKIGVDIVRTALEQPVRWLAKIQAWTMVMSCGLLRIN